MYKRGKGYYNSAYKFSDFYDWYLGTVSDPLPKEVFKDVFKTFIEQIMADLIYNSGEFNMGHRLGSIRVRDKEYLLQLDDEGNVDKSKLAVDWGKTLKKWRKLYPDVDPEDLKHIKDKPLIYLLNDHSDHTLKQWFWDKTSCTLRAQRFYKFNATRAWDRLLAKVNKESNITYFR